MSIHATPPRGLETGRGFRPNLYCAHMGDQNMAIGLMVPFPFGIGRCATVNMNSHRLRPARLALSARSRHDRSGGRPKLSYEVVHSQSRQVSRRLWHIPGRFPSQQRDITAFNQGSLKLQPAAPSAIGHGPSAARRAHDPIGGAWHRRLQPHTASSFPASRSAGKMRVPFQIRDAFHLGMSYKTARVTIPSHREHGVTCSSASRVTTPPPSTRSTSAPQKLCANDRDGSGRPMNARVRNAIGRTGLGLRKHRPLDGTGHVNRLLRFGIGRQRHGGALFHQHRCPLRLRCD